MFPASDRPVCFFTMWIIHRGAYGVKRKVDVPAATVYSGFMKGLPKLELTPEQRKIAAELGRQGGLARAKSMTAKERKASATKASQAAAAARKKKARAKKKPQ
jgi:hypothetical protein